jgi:hypothetical protein
MKSGTIRIPALSSESVFVKAIAVSLSFFWATSVAAAPANVESSGGLATPSRLPGAKPGAAVPAAAGGYAVDTTNGTKGGGELRYSAAGTTSSLAPLALTFPTPTSGNVTGWGDNTKTKLPNTGEVAISSLVSTGPTPPANTPVIVGRGEWSTTANASTLSAEASVNKAFKGYASGYANDPYTVAQGSYSVMPVLDGNLHLQTNPDDPASRAAIVFSAQSSGLGEANASLWTLGITLQGSSSPIVSFASASILGLNDMNVKTMLEGALDTSVPGTVAFKPTYETDGYILFSTTLSAGNDFQFGDTFQADALNSLTAVPPPLTSPIPEPGSLFLWLFGGVMIVGLARRRCMGNICDWDKVRRTNAAPNGKYSAHLFPAMV